MKDKKRTLPMNLQFFAEPSPMPDPDPEPTPEPNPNPTPEPAPDVQEQLQALMVENAKLKKAQEKAASEAADYKRKYNATLSEKEQASLEKAEKEAEREEQFQRLVRENQIHRFEKNFLLLGYTDKQAHEAAAAQYDGDTDALFKIQSEVQQALIKSKEAEWLKSRPDVNAGHGEDDEQKDPFLEGFNSVQTNFYRKK